MYKVGKILIVAGLFVVSAQAADKPAQGVVAKVTGTVSSAAGSVVGAFGSAVNSVKKAGPATTKFVTENSKSLGNRLLNLGVDKKEVESLLAGNIRGHSTTFYVVQGAKVLAVTAATFYALYYAYNKLFGTTTKQVVAEEEDQADAPVYYYVTTSRQEAEELARAAQTAVVYEEAMPAIVEVTPAAEVVAEVKVAPTFVEEIVEVTPTVEVVAVESDDAIIG